MKNKIRLDQQLLNLGLAPTRSKAQAMIMAGLVMVNNKPALKSGQLIQTDSVVLLKGSDHPYVSRGGVKLAGALNHFQIDPTGYNCLDVGASTGGFTDCLLQKGAGQVTALDVGYGQLAHKLRTDSRVTVIERTNARDLSDQVAPGPFDLITVDASFISLTLLLQCLVTRLTEEGALLCLVKPQFEAGREFVETGGVVRDENVHSQVIQKITDYLTDLRLLVSNAYESPILGPAGNKEFFLWARRI